jgi:hypothetical protein
VHSSENDNSQDARLGVMPDARPESAERLERAGAVVHPLPVLSMPTIRNHDGSLPDPLFPPPRPVRRYHCRHA